MSDVLVFVEVPSGSRNKYELDAETGHIVLDRRLFTSMSYPADYGFVEGTLGEDGDPLDALCLVGEPTFPGCRIPARVVGVFHMTDAKGPDEKILCVPLKDPAWMRVHDVHDIPPELRNEIEHFFQVYKDLEEEKVETRGFGNRAEAEVIVERRAPGRRAASRGGDPVGPVALPRGRTPPRRRSAGRGLDAQKQQAHGDKEEAATPARTASRVRRRVQEAREEDPRAPASRALGLGSSSSGSSSRPCSGSAGTGAQSARTSPTGSRRARRGGAARDRRSHRDRCAHARPQRARRPPPVSDRPGRRARRPDGRCSAKITAARSAQLSAVASRRWWAEPAR